MASYDEIRELDLNAYMTFVSYEEAYINYSYYTEIYNGTVLTEDNADEYLRKASRDIDSLTYNRIVAKGINNLTNFQKLIVGEVICRFAEFKYENKDVLNTFLNSYSIDNVSMDFANSKNLKRIDGITIPTELYNHLAIVYTHYPQNSG